MRFKWDSHLSCVTEKKSLDANQSVFLRGLRGVFTKRTLLVLLLVVVLGIDAAGLIPILQTLLGSP